jgi:hypothetical protein
MFDDDTLCALTSTTEEEEVMHSAYAGCVGASNFPFAGIASFLIVVFQNSIDH